MTSRHRVPRAPDDIKRGTQSQERQLGQFTEFRHSSENSSSNSIPIRADDKLVDPMIEA